MSKYHKAPPNILIGCASFLFTILRFENQTDAGIGFDPVNFPHAQA